MSSPKDITDALSEWDKHKRQPKKPQVPARQKVKQGAAPIERKLSPDLFSIWVYTLLFLTLLGQLGMLTALDIL